MKEDNFGSLIFEPFIKRALELLTAKNRHSFRFVLKDEIVRRLDKKTYKATMSWLRSCRREVEKELNFGAAIKELDGFFMDGWRIENL